MNIRKNVLPVIGGAIKGTLLIYVYVFGTCLLSMLPAGGPTVTLYRMMLYFGPIGAVIGALWVGVGAGPLRVNRAKAAEKSKNDVRLPRSERKIRVVTALLLSAALMVFTYQAITIETTLTHDATWTIAATEYYYADECDIPVVHLALREYQETHVVCSQALLNYLESAGDTIVPVIYHITRDLGVVRSYEVVRVGPIVITKDEWLGSSGGCGWDYSPPCDSPLLKKGSPLNEDYWPGRGF